MFDIKSAIIVFGIIGLILLPFILASLKKKQKHLKFLKEFNRLAEKEKMTVSQKELWGNRYAIGIDKNSGKLLYINKRKDPPEDILIDLSEVDKCRMAIIDKTMKSQDGKSNGSDRIELVFTFRKSGVPEKALEFYNNKEFMPTREDQSHAENWMQVINNVLSYNTVSRS
jgi:hypothetical protein